MRIVDFVRNHWQKFQPSSPTSKNSGKNSATVSFVSAEFLTEHENGNNISCSVVSRHDRTSDGRSSNCAETAEKLVCHFDESPYYILKVAAQGNLEEVVRLMQEDRNRLRIRDYRGQNIVHHAVTWSRVAVLDNLYQPYITSGFVDINGKDKLGNTPVFFAIEKNQMKALTWLLMHGASGDIFNNQKQAPIHYAIEQNHYEALQIILKHCPYTINLVGELGNTPLHVACSKDSADIAQLLFTYGADLLKQNDIGHPPIHTATANGSAKVIDVLLKQAKKFGMTEEQLIHMADKEKNLPLHLAVNSGDTRGVQVCLEAGADIERLNVSDRQTAVHYAAAQGSLEIIQQMLEAQPDKVETCLHCRDILEQTPLHKAAMFNHGEVVEYLIDKGASINAQDGERRTPLLLAAAKNASMVIKILLKRRANTALRDKENRNFLHLMVINNSSCYQNIELASLKTLSQLLNERDDFGMCPVHYASGAGQLATLKQLLQLGAIVTLKDNEKQSPLHFAAKSGRYQTCKKLLSSEQGSVLMNEIDSEGRTALHVAAIHGYSKIIALLVRNGAHLSKDFHQSTPLHIAAEHGNYQAVVFLSGLAPHHINSQNASKNTPLHLAALNGHACIVDYLMTMGSSFDILNDECATFFDVAITKSQTDVATAVIQHSRCEEAMQLPSIFGTPVIGLVQHLPKACIQLLDRCVTYPADRQKKSPEFYVKYDFRYLEQQYDMSPGFRRRLGMNYRPLLPMEMMVKFNRLELLSHPLSVTFLRQKWSVFGQRFYNIELFFYVAFLALLTTVTMRIDDQMASLVVGGSPSSTHSNIKANITMASNSSLTEYGSSIKEKAVKLDTSEIQVELALVIFFCSLNSIFQLIRAYQQGLAFFFDLSNLTEMLLYILTGIGFAPHLGNYDDFNLVSVWAGGVALFLGWINLLLYFRRTALFGIYVVMLIEVGKNLFCTLAVFSFIIIAFALEFYIVFKTTKGPTPEFKDPLVSIMTTFSMMASESNYVHFISPTLTGERELILGDMAYVVFVAFLLLLPTLLMNLLVGLAVGDIQATQKTAGLKRLAMQVQYFSDMQRRMPEELIKRCRIIEYKHYPNRFSYRFVEIYRNLAAGSDDMSQSSSEMLGDGDNGAATSEFGYVVEQLMKQSCHMRSIASKLEAQQSMMRSILHSLAESNLNAVEELEQDDSSGDESAIFLCSKKLPKNVQEPIAKSTESFVKRATVPWLMSRKSMKRQVFADSRESSDNLVGSQQINHFDSKIRTSSFSLRPPQAQELVRRSLSSREEKVSL